MCILVTWNEEFTRFVGITGKGKRPETWAIVVSCLRHVSLNYLGDIIEKEYTDSGTTGESPHIMSSLLF